MTLRFETLPLSTNALYRAVGGRSILSAKGRANKEAIGWEARSQYKGQPMSGSLSVRLGRPQQFVSFVETKERGLKCRGVLRVRQRAGR